MSAGEVEHERPPDNSHFENPQAVIGPEQLRHVKAEESVDPSFLESLLPG